MIDFRELEEDIDLSKWKRELGYQGRKRTKAGKYFWYIVLLNYHISRFEDFDIHVPVIVSNYSRIFYRDYELIMALLQRFKGTNSATIRNMALDELYQNYTKRMGAVWNGQIMESIADQYESKKKFLPEKRFEESHAFHSLTFLDKEHGNLPRISRQYKYMLDSFDYLHFQNKIALDKDAFFKPGTVKALFTGMDQVYLSYLMRRVAAHLNGFAVSEKDQYYPRKKVTSPTEALEFITTMHPKLIKLSNSELKYIININCCQPDGSKLDDTFLDSLSKAIRRYQKKHPKWNRLPLIEFKEKLND